jgi:hypothetical protein
MAEILAGRLTWESTASGIRVEIPPIRDKEMLRGASFA